VPSFPYDRNQEVAMGVVELTLRDGVTIKELHEAVEQLLVGIRPRGCTACGLVGVDLVLRGGDPEFYRQVSELTANKAVLSVAQTARDAVGE
jgi:hypothetical protein